MWETLDDIDWASLRHNYGAASDVPELLRLCRAGGDKAESDAFNLDNLLYHQGGWVPSAATAALPFLVDIAADSASPIREVVLGTVAFLAEDWHEIRPEAVDPGWRDAWRAVFSRFVLLAADEDPTIRRRIVDITECDDSAEGVRLLLDRLDAEPDSGIRVSIILGLGRIAARVTDPESVAAIDGVLARLSSTGDVQERYAALLARVAAGRNITMDDIPVMIASLRADDVHRWHESGTASLGALAVAAQVDEIVDAPEAIVAIIDGVMAPGASDAARLAALEIAASAVMRWRSVADRAASLAADELAAADDARRGRALHLLGCLGVDAASHADAVASLLDDSGEWRTATNRDIVLWTLTRFADRRAIPPLIECLSGAPHGFPDGSMFFSYRSVGPSLPSLGEILASRPEWSADLIPAVRDRLRAIDADSREAWALANAVGEWGSSAAPVVPELAAAMAAAGNPAPFAEAIGAIGTTEPVDFPSTADIEDAGVRRTVAFARYRVTGDASEVLPLVAGAVADGDVHGALERIGDLGALAVDYAPILRPILDSSDDWARARAAASLWRITGETERVVPVLASILDEGTSRGAIPVARFALNVLAEIGAAAAPAAPIVQSVLARDGRLAYFAGWRLFTEDEEFRALGARVLAAVDA